MHGLYQNKEGERLFIRMTFIDYIKSRKWILGLILMCSGIHVIVLYVYGYSTEPIWYATGIYGLMVLFAGVADYLRSSRRLKWLQAYDITVDKELQELVTAQEPVESQYQIMIRDLEELLTSQRNEYLQREKENSDFYTMWVHQIKTPIAAQRILLQTTPENVAGMKSELFKIERYVDIILNYLRMENINQDLLLKHYVLDSVVRQAVKKYSTLFIQSKLSLKLENLDMAVLTDEKWLVFVVEQLLSNAIKYTKTGEIRIYATTMEAEKCKVTRLCVEDTGIGIHPQDLPRIFDRAFTGYNGRSDKKASGLGLYLCKSILQKLGHEICITSALGQGTCVTLTFYEDKSLCGNLTKM